MAKSDISKNKETKIIIRKEEENLISEDNMQQKNDVIEIRLK